MKNKRLKTSLIYLILIIGLSGCPYTGEKLTPLFPDFSKLTANIFKAKQKDPLEFEPSEIGVSFSELEKRQLNKTMEPLVCFPVSQMQEVRREWERYKPRGNPENYSSLDNDTNTESNAEAR